MKWILTFLTLGLFGFALTTCEPPTKSDDDDDNGPDTTSHQMSWKIEKIGDGSSIARDVAIESDTSIWVVGKFYKLNNDTVFNILHWDGSNWDYQRIEVAHYGFMEVGRFETITIIEGEIWVVGEAGYAHRKNGVWRTSFNENQPLQVGTSESWAFSKNDVYFLGAAPGKIIHYNGFTFDVIPIPTNIPLVDIYGTPDGQELWVCGREVFDSSRSVLFRRTGPTTWEKLFDRYQTPRESPYFGGGIQSIYSSGKGYFYTVGGFARGIIKHYYSLNDSINYTSLSEMTNYPYKIRGSGENNIFFSGDAAMMVHFNGSSWQNYPELYDINSRIYSIDVSKTKIIAVGKYFGDILGNALVVTGTRFE